MVYCPQSGRIVDEWEEFCANCARRLYWKINNRAASLPAQGRWVLCPVCHGSTFIDDPDCDGKGWVSGVRHEEECKQCHGTGKIRCNYPECKNGRVWVND